MAACPPLIDRRRQLRAVVAAERVERLADIILLSNIHESVNEPSY